MSDQRIGRASRTESFTEHEGLVAFDLSYDESEYSVALSKEELDTILLSGIDRVMANRAVSAHDFTLELNHPDLPFYLGATSLDIKAESLGYAGVAMGIGVISQSMVHEHRGTLHADRNAMTGEWQKTAYSIEPPLKNPAESMF